jgi:uncharacterized membrane protein
MFSSYFLQNIIFGIIILLLDLPFISQVMAPKYTKLFSSLNLKLNTKAVYALLAYIVMIFSFYLIKNNDNQRMLINGAFVGFAIYGTYAFTLAAILPNYTLNYALTEFLWGILLYTTATFLTIKISKYFKI